MAYLQTVGSTNAGAWQRLLGIPLVIVCFLAAYFPTFKSLIDGPWQTEQEGHGPLIIAAAIFLVWQSRDQIRSAVISPAPVAGWALLLFGLAIMFLARTQGVLTVEVFSANSGHCRLRAAIGGLGCASDTCVSDSILDLFGACAGLDD